MKRITNIQWETDGQDVNLPTEVIVPSDVEKDEIADWLSDEYGFLVDGYSEEELSYSDLLALTDEQTELLKQWEALSGKMSQAGLMFLVDQNFGTIKVINGNNIKEEAYSSDDDIDTNEYVELEDDAAEEFELPSQMTYYSGEYVPVFKFK